MSRRGVSVLLAAALQGVVAAIVMELSSGLLLYSEGGFLRALTLILGVALSALAIGLASAPGHSAGAGALPRRWLLAIVALSLAALASAAWSLRPTFTGGTLGRGSALALLTAFPLYAVGTVLGGLAARGTGARVGAAATFGAAVGSVIEGGVLYVRLEPASVYLLCVVLTSAGALLQGRGEPPRGPVTEDAQGEEAPPHAPPGEPT